MLLLFFGAVGDFPPTYFDFSSGRGGGGLKLSPTSNFGNGKGAAHVPFFAVTTRDARFSSLDIQHRNDESEA